MLEIVDLVDDRIVFIGKAGYITDGADEPVGQKPFVDSNFRREPLLVLGFAILTGPVDRAEWVLNPDVEDCGSLVDIKNTGCTTYVSEDCR